MHAQTILWSLGQLASTIPQHYKLTTDFIWYTYSLAVIVPKGLQNLNNGQLKLWLKQPMLYSMKVWVSGVLQSIMQFQSQPWKIGLVEECYQGPTLLRGPRWVQQLHYQKDWNTLIEQSPYATIRKAFSVLLYWNKLSHIFNIRGCNSQNFPVPSV